MRPLRRFEFETPDLHGQKNTEPNEMHGVEIYGAESAHLKVFLVITLISCIPYYFFGIRLFSQRKIETVTFYLVLLLTVKDFLK